MKPSGLDGWRNYFRTATSDIFDIIEHAIMVAASDCPKKFKVRRDGIAQMLFSCRLARCSGCDRVELAVPGEGADEEQCKIGFGENGCDFDADGSRGSKVNSSVTEHMETKLLNQASNYSYGEAEALTDEIEEEGQIVGEVLRIKEIFNNFEDESDSVLFESLRRLQLMALSVDILKATEIGKAVNGLRKHGSRDIRQLARTVIDVWKDMVDEWVNTSSATIAEGTPDSINPSVVDEVEGLPSPPLDDGVFFATQPTSMELSQFFDGMDDDGNLQNSGEFVNSHDNGTKPKAVKPNGLKQRQQPPPVGAHVLNKDNKGQVMNRQEPAVKTNKPLNSQQSGPGRPPKPGVEQNSTCRAKYQQAHENVTIQKRPLPGPLDKNKHSSEDIKLEATKRKLQESYLHAENAKKQRTIQVMELRDLPKQGLSQRNPHMKPGHHNRHWANGRR